MRYVGGDATPPGCVFCNHLHGNDDTASLLLHRGERVFAMLNLYPYNAGHLMLVPNEHVPGPEEADPAALAELAALLPPTLRALRRALGCHGFNVGLNVGAVAGAGIAAHMHQHVVPRWAGDVNFMPVVGGTVVLPELLLATYGKVRAELRRELISTIAPAPLEGRVAVVVLDSAARNVAVVADGPRRDLPVASADPNEPLWRAAARLAATVAPADLIGWAGPVHADHPDPADLPVLAFQTQAGHGWDRPSPPAAAAGALPLILAPIEDALAKLGPADAGAVRAALVAQTGRAGPS
jgi:ATP adenylyltransferase